MIGCVRACFSGLSRCWNTNWPRNHQIASLDLGNDRNKRDTRGRRRGEKSKCHTSHVSCCRKSSSSDVICQSASYCREPLGSYFNVCACPQDIPSWCRGLVSLISHVSSYVPHLQSKYWNLLVACSWPKFSTGRSRIVLPFIKCRSALVQFLLSLICSWKPLTQDRSIAPCLVRLVQS